MTFPLSPPLRSKQCGRERDVYFVRLLQKSPPGLLQSRGVFLFQIVFTLPRTGGTAR